MSATKKKLSTGRILQQRRSRQTGTLVSLEDNRDLMGEDDEMPWVLICEDHGGLCGFESRAAAQRFAPVPIEWCPDRVLVAVHYAVAA